MSVRGAIAILLAICMAACTGAGDPAPSTSGAPTTTTTVSPSESIGEATTTTTTPQATGEDLLTYSSGVVVASWSGLDEGPVGLALQLIDGDETPVALAPSGSGPVRVVYRLPSETTFEAFTVPGRDGSAGHANGFSMLTISGSVEGPDSGFSVLGSALLPSDPAEPTTIEVASVTPVRWVEILLEGEGDEVEADERVGRALGEIVGLGSSAPQPDSDAFNGIWDLRSEIRPDARGERLELSQDGAIVTGCLDTLELRGTVSGIVARANAVDPATGRTAALVFVAADDGSLTATVAFEGGRFESRVAVDPGRVNERPCAPPSSEAAVCDTPLYVNFSYDSAEIRSESERVLDDIYRILLDLGVDAVTVAGHTSTEGTEEHNLALSEARAEAVAGALVDRGFPESGIDTVGFGESAPLVSPEPDEAARAINRRVELECG